MTNFDFLLLSPDFTSFGEAAVAAEKKKLAILPG